MLGVQGVWRVVDTGGEFRGKMENQLIYKIAKGLRHHFDPLWRLWRLLPETATREIHFLWGFLANASTGIHVSTTTINNNIYTIFI